MSDCFDSHERRVVPGAVAVVHAPRTMSDLLRRRVRIETGNAQAEQLGARRGSSHTGLGTLLGLVTRQPGLGLRLPVFVGVHIAARLRARRAIRSGDFTTWQRDESSRLGVSQDVAARGSS
jgi:hypothetical protein